MKLIHENVWKYLSVKLPIIGAFLLGVLPVLIQEGIDTQLIPAEYHALLLSVVLPALAYFGRKIAQPQLHNQPLGFTTITAGHSNTDPGAVNGGEFMKTSSNGTSLIKEFEGFVANAYLCPAKVWTIGIGTTIYPNGVKVKKGDKCTLEQALEYLQHDLKSFEKTVNESVKVPLSQNQFDALVSLAYNIGSGAFKNSTLLKKLNAKDYAGAADQFLVWNRGGGKVLKGLVRRREAERALFLKK